MIDVGVLSDSKRYYYEPDSFTADYLFYIPHSGNYHCNKDYVVNRSYLDICQFILVDSGSLTVEYRGKTQTAHSGMLVLLDCREPHQYYAACDNLRMRWFHFTGNSSQAYTNMLLESHGFIISLVGLIPEIESCFERVLILSELQDPKPHVVSATLHRLFALLAITGGERNKSQLELAIDKTAEYMKKNLTEEDISLEALADMISLSPYYYLRKFKEFYDVTPRQYLLQARITAAKEQLTTTSLSIENIGINCGFCNASHFIMAFRKHTGLTPLQYRNLWR